VFVLGVSTLGWIFIGLGVLIVVFLIGGVIAVVVRSRRQAGTYEAHVAAADAMLE
jgi:flagellar basal body-associated protein FliL